MRKAAILIGVILVLAGSGFVAYQSYAERQTDSETTVLTRTVRVRSEEMLVTMAADGVVEATHRADMRSRISGTIEQIAVAEGDYVEQGELLLALDDTDLRFALLKADDDLMAAQEDLAAAEVKAMLKQMESFSQVERSRENLEQMEQQLIILQAQEGENESDLLEAEAAYRRALTIYDWATGQDAVKAAEARVRSAQRALEAAEIALANAQIRSPMSGTITNLPVRVGDSITPSTLLASVIDFSSVYVVTNIDEFDIRHIQPGQEARVTADAYPDRSFAATVLRVADEAQRSNIVTFRTTLEVPNTHGTLRPGMTMEIEIITERKPDVLTVPISAIEYVEGQPTVVLRQDGEDVRQGVQLGTGDGVNMEIVSGLQRGDAIVVTTDPASTTSSSTTNTIPDRSVPVPGLSAPSSVPGSGTGRGR